MPEEYISFDRRLVDDPLWRRGRFSDGQAWVDLVLRAESTDTVVPHGPGPVAVARGQVFTSQAALARRWGWDRQTVRGYLAARVAEGSITSFSHTGRPTKRPTSSPTGYTLITIVKYEQYCRSGAHRPPLNAPPPSPPAPPLNAPEKLSSTKTKSISVVLGNENPKPDASTQEYIAFEAKKLAQRFAVAAMREGL